MSLAGTEERGLILSRQILGTVKDTVFMVVRAKVSKKGPLVPLHPTFSGKSHMGESPCIKGVKQ